MDTIVTDAVVTAERKAETRHLRPGDMPQICDLFATVFRKGQHVRREAVEEAFQRTYLTSPLDRMVPASLVDISSEGQIQGIMGVISLSVVHNEEHLRGGILGNFMAGEGNRAKSALRLLRKVAALDLDFLFTDTANRTSLDIGRALKYTILPLNSLEWVKVMRPCETASYLLGRRWRGMRQGLAPLSRTLDRVAGRHAFNTTVDVQTKLVDRAIDAETFAARAPAFVASCGLHPDWLGEEIHWLLAQAQLKTRNGPLHIREILTPAGKTVGLYLLYARKGGVAHALQVLTQRQHEIDVFNTMFETAYDLGAVAVRGAAHAAAVEAMMRQRHVFYHHVSATQVWTRRPDLKAAFLSPENCIGGLFGEGWTQLSTEDFA